MWTFSDLSNSSPSLQVQRSLSAPAPPLALPVKAFSLAKSSPQAPGLSRALARVLGAADGKKNELEPEDPSFTEENTGDPAGESDMGGGVGCGGGTVNVAIETRYSWCRSNAFKCGEVLLVSFGFTLCMSKAEILVMKITDYKATKLLLTNDDGKNSQEHLVCHKRNAVN